MLFPVKPCTRCGSTLEKKSCPPSHCRRNYTHLPVTSVRLPVDPSCRYEGFPHFVGFAERIK